MKKKNFIGIACLAIAAVAAFNVNLNLNKKSNLSLLTLANIEALAGEGVEQCDIFQYNRNYMEDWKDMTFSGTVGSDGYITIKNVKFGPFGIGAYVSFTYKGGVCKDSAGNCCLKTHVDRAKPF